MGYLWGSKTRGETEISKSALGEGANGDIVVVVGNGLVNGNLIRIGCRMAKVAKRKVHLVHVIEVPRTEAINAVLPEASKRADSLLKEAMEIAKEVGCEAVAEVVQARSAGPAIVEEARDHHCAVIFMGIVRDNKCFHNEISQTISYVLCNAACRVWVVQDPDQQKMTQALPVHEATTVNV
jgi:K+-sensing histidine kinase KdpD